LASEDVDRKLLGTIQEIADEVFGSMPENISTASAQRQGTWLHTQLEKRLAGLDNALVLTESSIDSAGRVVSRGTGGNPIPDIVILKKGESRAALLRRSESLAGRVDAVVDLKTGAAGMRTSWGASVGHRLRVSPSDIHVLRPGGSLVDDFARVPAARGLARKLVRRGTLKSIERATIIAGVLLAYQDAKARGMDDANAAGFAVASIYGGDLLFDGANWLSGLSWDLANDFARGSSAGEHIRAIESALRSQCPGGPTVDASGRKLESLLERPGLSASDSLLLIDR